MTRKLRADFEKKLATGLKRNRPAISWWTDVSSRAPPQTNLGIVTSHITTSFISKHPLTYPQGTKSLDHEMRLARSPPPTARRRRNEAESTRSLTDATPAASISSTTLVGGGSGLRGGIFGDSKSEDESGEVNIKITEVKPKRKQTEKSSKSGENSEPGDTGPHPPETPIVNSKKGDEMIIPRSGLLLPQPQQLHTSFETDGDVFTGPETNTELVVLGQNEDSPKVRRLSSEVYKPWGSKSTNTSPNPEAPAPRKMASENDKLVCRGGPGNRNCGARVGKEGVECDKCMHWFHCKCQAIPKAALTAMGKWHGTLLWLCDSCSASLKQPASCKCSEVMETVSKLEAVARHNASKIEASISNQEKMFAGQCKLLDKVTALTDLTGKKSYAEALKEAGREVVDQVGKEVMEQVAKKMEKIPAVNIPVQRSHEEVAGILDEIQDKEKRKLNVVVHNLKESDGDTHTDRTKSDETKFVEMVKDGMKLIVKPARSFRVGKKSDTKPRLMIVTLLNNADKVELLRSAASLRDSPKWSRVYITPDLTWQEREKGRQLRDELARRKESGEQHIWIRRGRIVPIPMEKQRSERDNPQPAPVRGVAGVAPSARATREVTSAVASGEAPSATAAGEVPSTRTEGVAPSTSASQVQDVQAQATTTVHESPIETAAPQEARAGIQDPTGQTPRQ